MLYRGPGQPSGPRGQHPRRPARSWGPFSSAAEESGLAESGSTCPTPREGAGRGCLHHGTEPWARTPHPGRPRPAPPAPCGLACLSQLPGALQGAGSIPTALGWQRLLPRFLPLRLGRRHQPTSLQAPKMPESSQESPSGTQDELMGTGPPWKSSRLPRAHLRPTGSHFTCLSRARPHLYRPGVHSAHPGPGLANQAVTRPRQPGPHTIPDRRRLPGPQPRKWGDPRAFQTCTPHTHAHAHALLSSTAGTRRTGCGRRCPRPSGWRR